MRFQRNDILLYFFLFYLLVVIKESIPFEIMKNQLDESCNSIRLLDIPSSDVLIPSFNPRLFNHEVFDPMSLSLRSSWLKILGLNLGVEKSGVGMSCNPLYISTLEMKL